MRKYLLAAAATAALSCFAAPAMAQCTGDDMLTTDPDGTETCGPAGWAQQWTAMVEDDPEVVIYWSEQTGEVESQAREPGGGQGGDGIYQPQYRAFLEGQVGFWGGATVHSAFGTAGFRIVSAFSSVRRIIRFGNRASATFGGAGAMSGATLYHFMEEIKKEKADCRAYVMSTIDTSDDDDCD